MYSTLIQDEVADGVELMKPGKNDGRVGSEVNDVPGFVAQPPPHDHQRSYHEEDQQRRADGSVRDARILREQRGNLARQGNSVAQSIADADEYHVRQDRIQA